MKIDMTAELWKLAEDAMERSRDLTKPRVEFDGHRAAHFIATCIPDNLVSANMPSEEDVRESIAGKILANTIKASRRRPRLENTLLYACEMREVIPEELVELPGKKLVPRSQLYAHEQDLVAASCKVEADTLNQRAAYEAALADPFLRWRDEQLNKGRPASHLTQMAFWLECGHVVRVAEAAE